MRGNKQIICSIFFSLRFPTSKLSNVFWNDREDDIEIHSTKRVIIDQKQFSKTKINEIKLNCVEKFLYILSAIFDKKT